MTIRLRPRRRNAGFTLVEMLIVLGIIGLLAGILLPGLTAARKAAQVTKCLNNLRQIGLAVTQYVNDNGQTLPTGQATNIWDDPASPRGRLDRNLLGGSRVIGEQLDGYLRDDQRIWRCPSARFVTRERAGTMRAPQVVQNGMRPNVDLDPVGDGARVPLYGLEGQWRPGYFYVSTRSWTWYQIYQPLVWKHFWMEDWMGRNVAGLKTSQLKAGTSQSSSNIVLFTDYSSSFHSTKAVIDVYDVPQILSNFNRANPGDIRREKFKSNFLYLDGHVETKRYGWAGGLLNVLHKPISQTWNGVDYAEVFADGYTNRYPD
jgi:prepilin-type N-terminal cleavage/methylation domain-containing protein/prepilin-type processing-associated H-X9-DG protein